MRDPAQPHRHARGKEGEAHVYFEEVRKELPALCQGTKDEAGELEALIVGRPSTSSLDAAVDALSAKAEGLCLYAYMLGQHLESEEGQVEPAWTEAKPFVDLIAAACEPITVAMAAALLRWDDRQQGA